MIVKEIAIVGLGVIGGSMGLAVKRFLPGIKVVGTDISPAVIEEALAAGVIDRGSKNLQEAVQEAEVVFLAVPMRAMQQVCREMASSLKTGTIVTDVGSTKAALVKVIREELPSGIKFLGGHPMAGSEQRGLKGAGELLFENAAYILTPVDGNDIAAVQTVRDIVEGIGAQVILMSPQEHDNRVAAVSHLPHVVASAMVSTVGKMEENKGGYFTLAAGGFCDSTRIAASQSEMWCNILLHNEDAILPSLKEFIESLKEYETAIANKDKVSLLKLLEQARVWREAVPTGLKGILPQLYELSVTVPDQPGVIGDISNLLGRNGINIADIEIMRVREEGGGTIRLGFAQGKYRDEAFTLMKDNGFNVQKFRL